MAMLRFLFRRLVAQRLLALGVVLTLAFSIGVMASGPIYTDAAREFIVTSSIATATAPTKNIRVDTYWDQSFSWTHADQMVTAAAADAGVPVGQIVRQAEASARVGPQQASAPVLFRDGGPDHLAFRSGAAPGPDEVAIPFGLAYSSGLHVGDRIDVLGPTDGRAGLRISGIFDPPTDASDPFWFGEGTPFNYGDNEDPDPIVVDRDTEQRLANDLGLTTHLTWDLYLNLSGITYAGASTLPDATTAFSHAMTDGSFVGEQLPDVATGIPVLVAQIQRALTDLRVPILLVLIQVWVVTLVVIAGVGVLLVARQSFELAVLHSRGFTGRTLLLVQAAQAALAALVALPLGVTVGVFLARFAAAMNGPRAGGVGFVTHLSGGSLAFAAGAAATGALVLALPSIPAVRRTILDERRQASRGGHPTLARVPVELFVLPVGLFALALLRNGDATPTGTDQGTIDPLLLFGPTLVLLGASFLVVRLLSWLVGSLDSRIGRSQRLATYLAGRRLAREPGIAFASAILVVLSVGLLFLSTSYRATILRSHSDAAHASVGTDWVASVGSSSTGSDRFDEPLPSGMAPVATVPLDGFRGRYAIPPTGLAVDPTSFRDVAWWRSDFASDPFNILMDRMASPPVGVPLATEGGPIEVTLETPAVDTVLGLRANVVNADGSVASSDPQPLLAGRHTYGIATGDATRLLSLTFSRPSATSALGVSIVVERLDVGGDPISMDGWTLLPTFGSRGRVETSATGGTIEAKLGIGGSVAGLEPEPPAVPAIVSTDVGAQEGSDLRLWAGYRTVSIHVVGRADAFPGIPPATPFVVASGPTMFALQGAVPDAIQRVDQVWAIGDTDPTAALGGAGFQIGRVASAQALEARLAEAPQSLAVGLDAAAATAGLGLVIAGVTATLYFAQRRRDFEFASLRAMGTSTPTVRSTIAREQIALVAAASVAGIALGSIVLRLVRAPLLTAVRTVFPAPRISVDVPMLATALIVIGVAAAIAIAAATRAALRAGITTVLRGDPE
jgi:FtsX-like permease family